MCTRPDLLATPISKDTGDPILFDDLNTPQVESKRQIAAAALLDAIDFLGTKLGNDPAAWRWGRLHTLTLQFPAGVDALNIPTSKESPGGGFPRHGSNGTVDVGTWGLNTSDFTFDEGPAIRFVCDLDPSGPKARNVLPGGESFDPGSSHYRDQMELWRKNQTFDLAFTTPDVLASANKELTARKALADANDDDSNRPAGRIRFSAPK
jgi:penicillin amidase